MDLSIIIVNYNTKDHIRTCLDSIRDSKPEIEYDIHIVDNNSSDDSVEFLKCRAEKYGYHLIINEDNLGFAKANNQAVRSAAGRYVMYLNPDTEMTPGGMDESVRFMDEHDSIGIMGPSIYTPEGNELRVCRKFSNMIYDFLEWTPILNKFQIVMRNYRNGELDYSRVNDVDYIQGACMVIRKKALDETGLLDERYFMYSEEEDLCRRMQEKGWKVVYNPNIKIHHYRGASTEKEHFNKYDTLFESKFLYFEKYYGKSYASVYRFTLISIMYLRKVYYTILMSGRGKTESYKYEKALSDFILQTLYSMRWTR